MKKGILTFLGLFMMFTIVEAKNGNERLNRFGFHYSYENAVNFVEGGVEFFIFTNGEFDFNTQFNNTYYDYNGIRVRNRNLNIRRDFRGRINKIENSVLHYDRYGNVTRIGNIFIRYYKGKLTNVGNLKVRYDRAGYPVFYGNVRNNFYTYNGIRFNLNIGDICDYNDSYFSRRDFRRNYSQVREDNNFYYYKANTNAKIGKRSKILRRRKPVSVNSKRNSTREAKRNNDSYRKHSSAYLGKTITTEKRKPSSVNYKRKTNTQNKSNNNSYRKPETKNRKVENKIKGKKVEKNTSERKRRN